MVFGGFGVVGWDGWGILAAVLGDVGFKMAFLADVGAMLRHVVGKMATKCAKTRQHKRKRAPRLAR